MATPSGSSQQSQYKNVSGTSPHVRRFIECRNTHRRTMITYPTPESLEYHPVVSRDQWLVARKELLKKEKELTRLRDEISAQRRKLPWVRVEKDYVFQGPNGPETLGDLFEGRSQLFVQHFMLGPSC
jgi:hypothetical protein